MQTMDGQRTQAAEPAAANKAPESARTQVVQLREEIASLQEEAKALRTKLASVERERQDCVVAHARASELARKLQTELSLLLASTSWKVTAPLRRVRLRLPPPVVRLARRPLGAAWRMIVTPRTTKAVPGAPYPRWIEAFEPVAPTRTSVSEGPAISLLLSAAAADESTAATLDGILRQAGAAWTIIAPDTSAVRKATASLEGDRRLLLVPCLPGLDRGSVLSALLAAVSDAWFAVLDSGDVLAPGALHAVAGVLSADPMAAAVYGDEDVLEQDGQRDHPLFKPAWSPELLLAYNYFGRLTVLSRAAAQSCGGFAAGAGDGAEWGLNLRISDAALASGWPIQRLTAVLCHRSAVGHGDRPLPGTRAAGERQRALHSYCAARGHGGIEVRTELDGTYRSRWDIADPPLVRVIIPSHNGSATLRRCVKGVLENTSYRNVEVVVVDANSDDPQSLALYDDLRQVDRVRVVAAPGPFNHAAACNVGARDARAGLLLFLSDTIEVADPGWLGELVRMACRPGVGVVGAKLRDADAALRHAGLAAGPDVLGLMFHGADEAAWGVFGSPNHTRNWSAVTGACQMVRRDVFDQVGGFDESYRQVNDDVALSLRASQLGYRTAFTPFAVLVHHQGEPDHRRDSAEDMARLVRELRRLGWEADPFFHPGLSGLNQTPTLRAPGEPSGQDVAHALGAQFLAATQVHRPALDLFDEAAVLATIGLPRDRIFPPVVVTAPISDIWAAARWIIALLRCRPDLRIRFPRAISDGPTGPFAAWLAGAAGEGMTPPPGLADQLDALWAYDPSTQVRQIFAWRDDVRGAHPAGTLPPGYALLARWLFLDCQSEYGMRPEEAWWFLLANAENPAAELVRAYRFNVAWQTAYPLGLTVFGQEAFALWIAKQYDVESGTAWLDPASWPDLPTPSSQMRLAYAHSPDWQVRHPGAFDTPAKATALLEWLASPSAGLAHSARAWCASQLADGLPVRMAGLAVNVIGHFCYTSGLRVSVNSISDAMEQAGVAVSRRNVRTQLLTDVPHTQFGGLEAADITIIHIQPDPLFLKCHERADLAERSPRTYRIGYWYWELDEVPQGWADMARAADEIWAATDFVADAIRKVVLDRPVRVFFPGVRLGAFTPRPREVLGAPARGDGRFAFLFSFHMASIVERKNPLGLIRAFRRAFRSDEPVDLVLKTTSEPRHAGQMQDLRDAAAGANVTIIDRVLTPDENLSLLDGCDAYVSLHRAEGLGLTMAEAMLLGKPTIATRYSGNLVFMDDSNSLLVDYGIRPIGRTIPPYDKSASWAEPSEEHAARLMRQLFEDPAGAVVLGRRGQASARHSMSLTAAGQRMAQRLSEIRRERRAP